MALPEAFLEEVRARTPLAALIGRRMRLVRSGRQWKGCCPFHGEKTPSFYVYEDHFHCFGCGAHGDAVSFVMQSESVGFMEAVERLAEAAGLTVPKPDARTAAAEQERRGVTDLLEAAAASFRRRLFLPEGSAALSYLLGRGLTRETIDAFGLGWSGAGRGALIGEFAREGVAPDELAAAGLVKAVEGTKGREFFFHRVMFPIRDRRGRVISFGGRLIGEAEPKYLNGPETAVFAKRRALYGLDRIGNGAAPIVVEGYMDVLALHQAGFASAVAPLGTALTEEQLGVLWRRAPAPVLCFDGDAAGARAAERALELALPLLGPERTLLFAALPEGEDPDSLIVGRGAGALRRVIEDARPLFTALYELARRRTGEATPEQRAALRAFLVQAAARIGDRGLAREYRRSLLDLSFASRRARKPEASRPAAPSVAFALAERMRQLVAIVLRQPGILASVEEDLDALRLPAPLTRLRAAIFAWRDTAEVLDSASLLAHLDAVGLAAEARTALAPVPLPTCAADTTLAEAEAQWREVFALVMNEPRLEEDLAAAERAFRESPDRASARREIAVKRERDAVRRGERPEAADA